jgi:DNA-binding NarL/FixJ family response regulator
VAGVSAVGGAVRVVIVDDDALVRAGLAMILGGDDGIQVVGQAGDGEEGVSLALRLCPDVVLMDIRMPVLDGLGATVRLLAEPTPPRVIVLTTFDADDYVVRALRGGASGFLLKDTPPAEIVAAVHKVAAGEHMLSPKVTAQLIARLVAKLSEREREVAVAVGQGLANAQIAAELYMSVATVKAHVSRILDKLGVENRVQVAICVHDAGIV